MYKYVKEQVKTYRKIIKTNGLVGQDKNDPAACWVWMPKLGPVSFCALPTISSAVIRLRIELAGDPHLNAWERAFEGEWERAHRSPVVEIYLGENLNNARHDGGRVNVMEGGRPILFLDGREDKNPEAYRVVEPGTYVVTRTDGTPPGAVSFYGHLK